MILFVGSTISVPVFAIYLDSAVYKLPLMGFHAEEVVSERYGIRIFIGGPGVHLYQVALFYCTKSCTYTVPVFHLSHVKIRGLIISLEIFD